MDRFFSKLDLRDIKIDPFNTSFPPDAEEPEPEPAASAESERREVERAAAPVEDAVPAVPVERDRTERQPHVPAWAPAAVAPSTNGHAAHPPAGLVEEVSYEASVAVGANGEVSEVLKVSARSRPSAVAGAIAGVVRENGRAEVQAIGAGATNQAVKACAIARDYLRETGIEAICLPAFIDVTIENEDRTAIRLVVEPR